MEVLKKDGFIEAYDREKLLLILRTLFDTSTSDTWLLSLVLKLESNILALPTPLPISSYQIESLLENLLEEIGAFNALESYRSYAQYRLYLRREGFFNKEVFMGLGGELSRLSYDEYRELSFKFFSKLVLRLFKIDFFLFQSNFYDSLDMQEFFVKGYYFDTLFLDLYELMNKNFKNHHFLPLILSFSVDGIFSFFFLFLKSYLEHFRYSLELKYFDKVFDRGIQQLFQQNYQTILLALLPSYLENPLNLSKYFSSRLEILASEGELSMEHLATLSPSSALGSYLLEFLAMDDFYEFKNYLFRKAMEITFEQLEQLLSSFFNDLLSLDFADSQQLTFHYSAEMSLSRLMLQESMLKVTSEFALRSDLGSFVKQIFSLTILRDGRLLPAFRVAYQRGVILAITPLENGTRSFPLYSGLWINSLFLKEFIHGGEIYPILGLSLLNLPRIALTLYAKDQLSWPLFFSAVEQQLTEFLDRILLGYQQNLFLWREKAQNSSKMELLEKDLFFFIGIQGLSQVLMLLEGGDHGESLEIQEKGLELVAYIFRLLELQSSSYSLRFLLYGQNSELSFVNLLQEDREQFGLIDRVTTLERYSSGVEIAFRGQHLSLEECLEREAKYAPFLLGGLSLNLLDKASYPSLEQSLEMIERLIRKKSAFPGLFLLNQF